MEASSCMMNVYEKYFIDSDAPSQNSKVMRSPLVPTMPINHPEVLFWPTPRTVPSGPTAPNWSHGWYGPLGQP
tara:strand:+ start:331 stop:549 length:219 start_codon:yes stop_codon:yes gene_type:complete